MLNKSYVDGSFVRSGQLHCVVAVVQSVLPRVHEECEPELSGRVALENLLDGDEVFETLGHLAPGYREVTGVKEVADPVIIAMVGLK